MMKNPIEQLITLLAPETCIICGKPNIALCESCVQTEVIQKDTRCYKCNKLTKKPGVCRDCPSRLRRIWWLGKYEGPIKDIIWEMKFRRAREHARLLGKHLADALPYLSPDTLVVPIPTATRRIRRRGFDQAKLIAQSLATQKNLKYRKLLDHSSQTDLIGKSRRDRRKLVQQNLTYSGKPIIANTVLLVDDVLTTGSTIETAAALLRKNGAKHVDAAVVAH